MTSPRIPKQIAAATRADMRVNIPAEDPRGQFGRWAFVEITDWWDAVAAMRRAGADAPTGAAAVSPR
jgi:hypothetical protein